MSHLVTVPPAAADPFSRTRRGDAWEDLAGSEVGAAWAAEILSARTGVEGVRAADVAALAAAGFLRPRTDDRGVEVYEVAELLALAAEHPQRLAALPTADFPARPLGDAPR